MNPSLSTEIIQLPRIGAALSKALRRLKIGTVQDLLFHFPYRYLDYRSVTPISKVREAEIVTIRGAVKTIASRYSFRGRMSLAEAIISDDSGSLKVIWFNQPYLAKYLKVGDKVLLSGKASFYKSLQLQNPVYEKLSEDTIHTGRIVPVYHTTESLPNRTIRTIIKQVLSAADDLTDDVPNFIRNHYGLPILSSAVKEIHFPTSYDALETAQQKIVFDELFTQQLAVLQHKLKLQKASAPNIPQDIPLIKSFLATLPFQLTLDQKKSLWQIVKDISGPHPMNRLLQGDVGSGKTLVALVAALEVAKSRYQTALLAPTEILAKQHFDTFSAHLTDYKVSIALLTNQFSTFNNLDLAKPQLRKKIQNSEVDIVIGTHAVLQKGVFFKKLGLVIIDEQHRFGVQQRSLLLQNARGDSQPHLLSMTATPIPRTLAMSIYSDLEVSTLEELPTGRKEIITKIVLEGQRDKTYNFIREQIKLGRQAFVVTPRVEEGAVAETKSAKAEFARLQKEIFPKFKLGLLYGSMKGREKEQIMADFSQGKLNILVATSVIEVGIDVPNASVMLIEGAESFGLAQLHQLRGRVGRGKEQSYCFVFTESSEPKTLERLETFTKFNDGFKLAELDLKNRGMGSLFGTEQSGFDFKFSQFLTMKSLRLAKAAAEELIQKDPELQKFPALKQKVQPFLEKIHLE